MSLRGKKVLVTGGARRIGRAIVQAVAGAGADVVIHYRESGEEAEAAAEEARGAGSTVMTVGADLETSEGVRALVEEATAAFGRIDVLVNNASIYRPTPLESLTEKDWDAHLDVNLKAPFLCALELGRGMVRRGEGKIVNLADMAGDRPYPGFLPYCVSKAGLIALTRGLAVELAPQVQVNAVAPGPILNPEGFSREEIESVPMSNPMRRMGSAAEVAAAVAFLADGPEYLTGAVVPVDGGWQFARGRG